MKYVPFILIALLFFAINTANALRLDCADRGLVSLELPKEAYFPGESIQGEVIITNKNIKSSPFSFIIKISKDNYIPWERSAIKNIDPGTQVLKLQHIFGGPLSTPYVAEIGDWELQLITQVDDCVWYEKKIVDIFSCSDGIQNGNEKGVDCGGFCSLKCPVSTNFPGQVVYHKGYYKKEEGEIWRTMGINSLSIESTHMEGKWVEGNQISLNVPLDTHSIAVYGCCCPSCNNDFQCNMWTDGRYKVKTYKGLECGWNIKTYRG
ncbi:hypothetical protein CL621_00170 [archaeon]|nr:hypothetical protein [archaeon]|tara:strand:+ start:3551 stop:4342 length:792 start_codon:yes stop_codon:yes gene_type:complete